VAAGRAPGGLVVAGVSAQSAGQARNSSSSSATFSQ
jgi:hypothetical protein